MTSAIKLPLRKADKSGRTVKTDDHHFRLYDWMYNSPAWRALKPAEVAVYLHIEMRFYGTNNGRLAVGVRELAERCHVNKDTASRCLRRLAEMGFIECVTPGGFSQKTPHVAEWRLTRVRSDATGEPASKDFMRWRPSAERGPKRGTVRSETETSRGAICA